SAANLGLRQPIVGIMTSPSGNGYRMFARDGGIFSFGDTPFLGSLPGIGIHVTDVVGVAATPTNRGYWIVRQGGQVYAFGDARYLGNYGASPADPVAAAVADPAAAGYRLITRSGRTIPFGFAPGGSCVTGPSQPCLTQLVCRAQLRTAADYQAVLNTRGPLWDGADGAPAVDLQDGRRLWLFGDSFVGDSNATSLLPGFFILRNTAAVEQGNCFDFRLGGTTAAADYLPRPSPNEWLWPMSGFADPVAGVVRVSALRVTTTSGPAGFNFKVESTELVTLDLRTLAYRSSAPMPSGGGSTNWGTAIVATPDWVYLYGQDGQSRQYVARTTRAHLFDGQWQFNTPAGWSTDASAVVPMQFQTDTGDADPGPTAAANVVPYGAGFVLSAKRCEILCDDVTAWYASNPNGPWSAVNSDSGRIATTVAGPCQFTYGGHLVPVRNSPLVLWSVNCSVPTTAKYAYGVVVATPQNLPAASQLASP
ncbi:MAG TPA: hypothetical protein VN636_16205, partial [Acidimicrobiia bacterium]|nr:hypothetical protein [Acidimicrobiia bacterium]